ncbi:MAG: ATP-dependent helicase [Candidatus Zambryskibacteria bacterium]|nr:ATP-dependent helicase [Candidatus Zambryskibacteria bacterium]
MNETWWVNPDQLDDDQKKAIELPIDKSYLIIGPPGSGKTNLLLLHAEYLVRSGKPNVLILSFTRTLKEFIVSGGRQYAFSSLKVKTCIMWEIDLLKEYGITPEECSDFTTLRRNLVCQVQELISNENLANIYDAILLDESQDWLPEEIKIFKQLGKVIFAVADSNQKIYDEEGAIDLLRNMVDEEVKLRYHYRNGRKICCVSEEVLRKNDDYKFLSPTCNYNETANPSSAQIVRCDNIADLCGKIIVNLSVQVRAFPDELLGVLCLKNEDLELIWAYIESSELASLAIRQASNTGYVNFTSDKRICVSTIHSAKGLEFRTVHIANCDNLSKFGPQQKRVIFTAMTRAKTALQLYYLTNVPEVV